MGAVFGVGVACDGSVMDWSLLANVVMAVAAGYGVVSWRLGRRNENEHDAALAALKAALKVANEIDGLLDDLGQDVDAGTAEARRRNEDVLASMSAVRVAMDQLRDALVEVRALWGWDSAVPVIRLDTYANVMWLAFAKVLGMGRARWRFGDMPDVWALAAKGDREAARGVSEQVTALLDDIEAWAEPLIRRRPWWEEARRGERPPGAARENAATRAGLAEIFSRYPERKRLPGD